MKIRHVIFSNSRRIPIIIGLSLVFILIQYLALHKQLIEHNVEIQNLIYEEENEFIQPEHLNEIWRILNSTPNLWGSRGNKNPRNESIATRVQFQREWVQHLGSTEFIKHVKPKKILVYLEPAGGDFYFSTENKLKCPYAPDFENKCDLVLKKKGWRELIQNHPPHSYYRDLKVQAVVGNRNGYWGLDSKSEPSLPPGIHQIYHIYESPCHTESAPLGRNGAWLASYWKGADIPIPYGHYIAKPAVNAGSSNMNYFSPRGDVGKDNRRLVVALISNCKYVENGRMSYIARLRKYIPVDVFGKCGDQNLTCPTSGDCFTHLGSQYKFYLAFENCNCEDYITEKFLANALQHNMIPIVMGASPKDYADVAPPNSFIHVCEFANPRRLAEYLQLLDKDEILYRKYGEWRNSSGQTWELTHSYSEDFFCRACGLLYYAEFMSPPNYPNRLTTWKDLNKCLRKYQWRWPTKRPLNYGL